MSNALRALSGLKEFFLLPDDGPSTATHLTRAPGSQRGHIKPRGHGYRRLPRAKTVNGFLFHLHATRGWKCMGKVQ